MASISSSTSPSLHPVYRPGAPGRPMRASPPTVSDAPALPRVGDGSLPTHGGILPIANDDGTTPRGTGHMKGLFSALGGLFGSGRSSRG